MKCVNCYCYSVHGMFEPHPNSNFECEWSMPIKIYRKFFVRLQFRACRARHSFHYTKNDMYYGLHFMKFPQTMNIIIRHRCNKTKTMILMNDQIRAPIRLFVFSVFLFSCSKTMNVTFFPNSFGQFLGLHYP